MVTCCLGKRPLCLILGRRVIALCIHLIDRVHRHRVCSHLEQSSISSGISSSSRWINVLSGKRDHYVCTFGLEYCGNHMASPLIESPLGFTNRCFSFGVLWNDNSRRGSQPHRFSVRFHASFSRSLSRQLYFDWKTRGAPELFSLRPRPLAL